ncbi:hypothetical protein BV20DRAFT_762694 [Pilatotrama ljubarskyi]|nr:hypothetical protein BV20DRAFT_762694 [Pilatotrama ljubarskyi]
MSLVHRSDLFATSSEPVLATCENAARAGHRTHKATQSSCLHRFQQFQGAVISLVGPRAMFARECPTITVQRSRLIQSFTMRHENNVTSLHLRTCCSRACDPLAFVSRSVICHVSSHGSTGGSRRGLSGWCDVSPAGCFSNRAHAGLVCLLLALSINLLARAISPCEVCSRRPLF